MKNQETHLPPLVIPAYEPRENLIGLIDQLASLNTGHIVVVDDGSSLDKKGIFDQIKLKPKVMVLKHAVNLGKGSALKTAFNHLLVHFPDIKGAVTVDADGQHLPADVRNVGEALLNNPTDLVLGSRSFQTEVPFRSYFGNMLTAFIFRFLVGKKISDTQTGLRGIPESLMRKCLSIPSNRYEFELDMLITAIDSRVKIDEVKIATIYENKNENSHFNPLQDSFRIYFVFLRFISLSLLTFGTDFTIFFIAFKISANLFVSVLLGRAIAAFVSISGSKIFVFKSHKNFLNIAVKMLLLWALLLGLSYEFTLILTQKLQFNVYLSRILVDSVLFVFNFLVQRDLIFKRRDLE